MRSISTDYSQNPQQKVVLLYIFLSFIVSSRRRKLPFNILPSSPVTTDVNVFLVPMLAARQSYSRLNVLRLQFFPYIFRGFLIAVAC